MISQSGLLDSEWVREVLGLSLNVGLESLAESLNIPGGSQDKDSLKVLTELPRSQSMKVLALLVGGLVIVVMMNEGALLHFHDMGKDHGMRKRNKRCKVRRYREKWRRRSSGDSWSRQRAPLEQKAASYKHYSKSSELRNKSEASRGSLLNFSAASYRTMGGDCRHEMSIRSIKGSLIKASKQEDLTELMMDRIAKGERLS
ncbi:hypothetical protein L6452_27781 [Arctium lappa]|uniref:Uncharacterized protein n=1 Tax=Arctium lappa TaxID=4217 RepID=A0ACB8ZX15_ARCLA|nr:hypothetical protein L6452_27781 [Arctium lappa]